MTTILVDSDPIVYRCAFACQEEVGGHVVPLPYEELCKSIDNVVEKIRDDCESEDMDVVLSGKGNYRYDIAKARPYKGNRTAPRPYHYDTAREWLQAKWTARVVDGIEADDEICIRAHALMAGKQKYIIATIDKDLDQIPGQHYDYRLHVKYYVHPDEARLRFWCQVLAGDATDNIPGVQGIGFKTAERLLRPMMEEGAQDRDIWQIIEDTYVENDQPVEQALETAQLVYLLRKPNEMWRPPV